MKSINSQLQLQPYHDTSTLHIDRSQLQDTLLLNSPKDRSHPRINDAVRLILTVLDARDPYTFKHSLRVTQIATLIATEMNLPQSSLQKVHDASYLHDIGKIGIPDRILNKVGRLSNEEIKCMQAHPRIGYNILSQQNLFKDIAEIVLYHHERWDGLGYPLGLKGDAIPLESRIIAVADAFDAITSDRPYRKGLPLDHGVKEILRHRKDQFDSRVVDHFMNIHGQLTEAMDTVSNTICPAAFNGHQDLMHSRRLLD